MESNRIIITSIYKWFKFLILVLNLISKWKTISTMYWTTAKWLSKYVSLKVDLSKIENIIMSNSFVECETNVFCFGRQKLFFKSKSNYCSFEWLQNDDCWVASATDQWIKQATDYINKILWYSIPTAMVNQDAEHRS